MNLTRLLRLEPPLSLSLLNPYYHCQCMLYPRRELDSLSSYFCDGSCFHDGGEDDV